MKVYIASWFASKTDMKKRAETLRSHNIEVTSRWLEELLPGTTQIHEVSGDYLEVTGIEDLEDVLKAHTLVLNVPSDKDIEEAGIPVSAWARGGRHFEAGFHYATMVLFNSMPSYLFWGPKRELLLVGHRENVFHYIKTLGNKIERHDAPAIKLFNTWEEVTQYLIEKQKNESIPTLYGEQLEFDWVE